VLKIQRKGIVIETLIAFFSEWCFRKRWTLELLQNQSKCFEIWLSYCQLNYLKKPVIFAITYIFFLLSTFLCRIFTKKLNFFFHACIIFIFQYFLILPDNSLANLMQIKNNFLIFGYSIPWTYSAVHRGFLICKLPKNVLFCFLKL